MEWFSGNIPEAIQLAKSRQSIFIVYIQGDDDAAKAMDKMWEDEQVSQHVKQEAAVAIKLDAESESCTFFSQIYPVVVVPSVYFIGHNGVPLEVLGGNVMTPETFTQKVCAVLEKYKSSEASSSPSSPPEQLMQQQQQQQQQSQVKPSEEPAAATAEAASSLAEPGASSDATEAANVSEDAGPDSKKAKVDINDRVERAKQLIEEKRIQKVKEEKEKERQQEIERRKMGQSIQQLKQTQQEREAQEVKEHLRKEKEEQRKARERVKEQIERDRADRNAKYQKEKAQKEEQQDAARIAKLVEQQKAAAEAKAKRSEIARIQFRLPDGSSLSNQFPSAGPLQEAADFISARLGGAVTLSTAFPRRTFTQNDMALSFQDLQLAPSAVVIVVPADRSVGGSIGGGGGSASGVLSMLFAPLMMVWRFLLSFFISPPAIAPTNANNASSHGPTSSAAGGDRVKPSTATKRSRQEGNVRRLRNSNDDDDEDNATWNGNSTQQM